MSKMSNNDKKIYTLLNAMLDNVYISDLSIAERINNIDEIVAYAEYANIDLTYDECVFAQKCAQLILADNPDFSTNSNADNYYHQIDDAIAELSHLLA